jgi:hypothetical protein
MGEEDGLDFLPELCKAAIIQSTVLTGVQA